MEIANFVLESSSSVFNFSKDMSRKKKWRRSLINLAEFEVSLCLFLYKGSNDIYVLDFLNPILNSNVKTLTGILGF